MTIPRNLSTLAEYAGAVNTPTLSVPNVGEVSTISATGATGTLTYDVITQSVLYYTTNAVGNWTLNIRGNSTTTTVRKYGAIAVNPPTTPVTNWPVLPDEVWSS